MCLRTNTYTWLRELGNFQKFEERSHIGQKCFVMLLLRNSEINLEKASTKQTCGFAMRRRRLNHQAERNAGQSDGRQTNRLSSRSRPGRVRQRHSNAWMAGPQKENNEDAKSLELSSPHGHGQRIPRVRISSSWCFAAPSSSTEGTREIM